MSIQRPLVRSLAFCILFTASNKLFAAGFELPQKGVKELATGYGASAALLEDASAIANNPAGLMRLKGRNFTGGMTLIKSRFNYDHTIHRDLIPSDAGTVPGESSGNISGQSYVPHIYYSRQLSDNTTMGFGLYVPFGSTTDYGDKWAGRYHATSTALQAINLNPVFAWRESERLSFGIGAVVQIFSGEFKNKIDVGYLVADQVIKTVADNGLANLRGGCQSGLTGEQCVIAALSHKFDVDNTMAVSSIAYGFNFGMLWEHSEKTRIGLNYASRVRHVAEGKAERPETLDPAFQQRLEQAIRAVRLEISLFGLPGFSLGSLTTIGVLSPDDAVDGAKKAVGPLGAAGGDISLDFTSPDIVTLSGFHQWNDNWAFMGGVTWTKWDYIKEMRFAYTDDSDRGGSQLETEDVRRRDLVVPFEWQNTFRYGVGAIYTGIPRLTLYAGAAYDESPVPDESKRTARGPDSNRIIMSGGFSFYLTTKMNVDVGYAYTHFTESKINNLENPAGTYHRMEGSYQGSLESITAQVNYAF